MVILKENPVGEDVAIQQIQKDLHEFLLTRWGMESADYLCYGRCYRNQNAAGYLPEVFIGGSAGKDYKDAFHNDKVTATSFFGITGGKTTFDQQNTANVHLIFSVNIQKVKDLLHRADAEVRADVQQFLEEYGYADTGLERITDIDRVFSEYTAWRGNENLKHSDMHPKHCFRFNFSITYDTLACPQPLISQTLN